MRQVRLHQEARTTTRTGMMTDEGEGSICKTKRRNRDGTVYKVRLEVMFVSFSADFTIFEVLQLACGVVCYLCRPPPSSSLLFVFRPIPPGFSNGFLADERASHIIDQSCAANRSYEAATLKFDTVHRVSAGLAPPPPIPAPHPFSSPPVFRIITRSPSLSAPYNLAEVVGAPIAGASLIPNLLANLE